MKAFIPAAGLGTRLRPFTLTNPKALVEVEGVTMLERVILKLKSQGFDYFVINLHHFGDKIEEFLKSKDSFGVKIIFSDERDLLRDTGGALLHASQLLSCDSKPFLIHNVDILSNANLRGLMKLHDEEGNNATLLVSERNSSRRLLFDDNMSLRGWHNLKNDEFKPSGLNMANSYRELAFSGIHVISPETIFSEMARQKCPEVFSVIDFYLSALDNCKIKGALAPDLELIDIGKPETLALASTMPNVLG